MSSPEESPEMAKVEELNKILATLEDCKPSKEACDEITAFVTSKQAEDGLVCHVPTDAFLNTGGEGGCACVIS